MIAGGTRGSLGNQDMMLVRLNLNRTVDGGFGSGGVALVAFDVGGPAGLNKGTACALAIRPDGKVVLAGEALASQSLSEQYGVLARLLPNGTWDATFGPAGDGRLRMNFSSTFHAVALDRGGVIIAAGAAFDGTTSQFLVGCFLASGAAMAPGTGIVAFKRQVGDVGTLEDILIRCGGDFLVTGFADVSGFIVSGAESDVVSARFSADGSPYASYGSDGKSYAAFTMPDPGNRIDYRNDGYRLAFGSGGILIGGLSRKSSATRARFGLIKLQFDPIFDDGFENP